MRNKSQYKTRQRDLVSDCLLNNKNRHMTVDQVREYLKERGSSIGQTTIYRNLDKLFQDGIVLRFVVEGTSACYQYADRAGNCHNHYHLICVDCGRMIHLQCDYLDELSSHINDKHQFELDSLKTVLYGHCDTCAASR
jgi:Fur family transcriptional regulator, ferric uptake regulator